MSKSKSALNLAHPPASLMPSKASLLSRSSLMSLLKSIESVALTDAAQEAELLKRKQKYLSSITPDKKKEMAEIFTLFDTDGSGNIDPDELRVVLKAMGVFLSPEELEQLMQDNLGPGVEEMELDDFMYLTAVITVSVHFNDRGLSGRINQTGKKNLLNLLICFLQTAKVSHSGI